MATGIGLALFCAMLLAIGVFGVSLRDGIPFLSKLCAGLALLCAPAAVFLIGMAVKDPVALRMDQHGISGYYTSPARWSDIAKVGLMVGPKSEKYLGFALKDPVGFRANQTAFQRFTSWQNGLSTEYHITVPQSVLRSTTVETLSEQAQALHLSTHAEVT